MTPIEWLLSGDTGASSETILAVMEGIDYKYPEVPRDPADFGRCYRLLEHFPSYRQRLSEVADKHPAWKQFVANWGELEEFYRTERYPGRRPMLYGRMKDLRHRKDTDETAQTRGQDDWEDPYGICEGGR